jgi:hypothetical protein
VARGESPKERPLSIGLAIVAIVAVASICALYSVVASMHTTTAATTPYTLPGPVEPFRGATAAFATLGSRDSTRALLTGGTAFTRNPAAARAAMEGTLRDRGYVVGATAETASAPLPLETTPADLDGACGVVLVVGDVATTLTVAGVAGGTLYHSVDPSAFTIATCGTAPVRVEGSGEVSLRTWLLPGITEAAMTSTGLSADALLAHAEAELLLRRRGYVPVDEIVEVAPATTTAGGFVTMHLPTTPTAGCIPFVAYVEGAGRPQLPPGRFDFLDDRGLSGAVACATTTAAWEPLYVDDGTVGARVFVRAYAPGPGGTVSTTLSIASAHTVDASHARWPAAISDAP